MSEDKPVRLDGDDTLGEGEFFEKRFGRKVVKWQYSLGDYNVGRSLNLRNTSFWEFDEGLLSELRRLQLNGEAGYQTYLSMLKEVVDDSWLNEWRSDLTPVDIEAIYQYPQQEEFIPWAEEAKILGIAV